MNPRFLLAVAAIALFAGCSKEHEACFTVPNADFVCPGISVSFENCGDPDDTYNWNFGDGTGIKAYNTAHTFQEEDTFRVYQAAGTGKKAVRDSIDIIVALPTGLRVTLVSLPTLAPDGQTWDPTGGDPDIRLWIFDENNSTIFNTAQENNVVVPHNFSLGGTTLCKGCTWRILLLDSQNGSDFDTVYELTADYTELATQRVRRDTAASGAIVQIEFEAH